MLIFSKKALPLCLLYLEIIIVLFFDVFCKLIKFSNYIKNSS